MSKLHGSGLRRFVPALLAAAFLVEFPSISLASFYTMANQRFSVCSSDNFCVDGPTCVQQEITGPGVQCFTECKIDGTCDLNSSFHVPSLRQILSSKSYSPDSVTTIYDANALVFYDWSTAGEIGLSMTYVVGPSGQLEIAVFRYDGDPSSFDGLRLTSAQELVELGIVSAQDVVWTRSFMPGTSGFEFEEVDTGQIPADELVVFVAGDGPGGCSTCEVPATGAVGSVLLLAAMVGSGTLLLSRPRRLARVGRFVSQARETTRATDRLPNRPRLRKPLDCRRSRW